MGVALALTAGIAGAQGAQRPMTKQEFAACEQQQLVQWQVSEIYEGPNRIDALRGQSGKEQELAQAERHLAAGRAKGPLDFWWEDSGAGVAEIAAGDRATTERRLREEKGRPESARGAALICMYEVRLEFLQTGKVRPAKVRRALTRAEVNAACGPLLVQAQEVDRRWLPAEVEKLRKEGKDPQKFPLAMYARKLAGAQSKSAIDYFWENTIGYDYIAKIAGGGMSDVDQRIRINKSIRAALEAGDQNTYIGIVGGRPPTGVRLEEEFARNAAQTCVLELRQQFQRTGKLPAAAGTKVEVKPDQAEIRPRIQ